ncbi:hypothetical protein NCH01_27690 [Neoasaia chiangmaiensis]|nr:hypothetical protein [Neoasaia chiangmaiensis]GEN16338.1 hypothetical protein NCH01_27690 [Neoasaia chiangmaiensis]
MRTSFSKGQVMSLIILIGHAVIEAMPAQSVTTFPQDFPQDVYDRVLQGPHKFVAVSLERRGTHGSRDVCAIALLVTSAPYDDQEVANCVYGFVDTEPTLRAVARQKDLMPALSRLGSLASHDLRDVNSLERVFAEIWIARSRTSMM